jgi:xanthine/CO dehydrogenase XdhC/CoxF family maturation factor
VRDLLADYDRLAAEGVTAGSVSGGCVEDAVAGEIADAIR